jgi:hypothetical protein
MECVCVCVCERERERERERKREKITKNFPVISFFLFSFLVGFAKKPS